MGILTAFQHSIAIYFEMVKRFGDVPWYDTELFVSETDQLNKPRDSRELVMKKILEDLDFAITNLSTTPSVYTVTKWTALSLKSRVCLFEGTFRKYHNLNHTGNSLLHKMLQQRK